MERLPAARRNDRRLIKMPTKSPAETPSKGNSITALVVPTPTAGRGVSPMARSVNPIAAFPPKGSSACPASVAAKLHT